MTDIQRLTLVVRPARQVVTFKVAAKQGPPGPPGNGAIVGPNSAVTGNFVAFADASGKAGADSGYNYNSFASATAPALAISAHVAASDPHGDRAAAQAYADTAVASVVAMLAGYVPTTRTINGHALSSNVTLTAADVGVAGALIYRGALDCSTNPNYPAGAVGDVWVVTVGGKIGGASGLQVFAKGQILCVTANAGGTQAAVGADWVVMSDDDADEVLGPSSAVDGHVALFNGTSGKLIKDGGALGTAAFQASTAFATAAQGATADNALPRAGGTMTGNIAMGGNAVTGAKSATSSVSGAKTVDTTYADTYITTDSGGVTWTLPANGVVGQTFVVIQGGAGQITFAAASGATVGFSAGSHTKTARQYAAVTIMCISNAGGSAAVWIVSGATA